MRVFHDIDCYSPPRTGITLTIGNFDGVHRGHQRIIETARRVSQPGLPLVALTFEPHPLVVIAPGRAPARLTTLNEKLHLLGSLGVDACIVVRSQPALLEQSAETFLANLYQRCRPQTIVEGPDFNFGRGRGGSVQTLCDFAARRGFAVRVVETACCDELPNRPVIRSSAIRAALHTGRVDVAWAMLGRPHRVVGTVGPGAGRGMDLGFPTANLDGIPHLLPQEAVYVAAVQLEDGSLFLAAANVGPQPTFGCGAPRVEAHVLDWSGSLRGRPLGLSFLARLRRQEQFPDPDQLSAQLRRDVVATRAHADTLQQLTRAALVPL